MQADKHACTHTHASSRRPLNGTLYSPQRLCAQHNEHELPSPTHLTPQNLSLAGPVQWCLTTCWAATHQLSLPCREHKGPQKGCEEPFRTSGFSASHETLRPRQGQSPTRPPVHLPAHLAAQPQLYSHCSLSVLPFSSGCFWRNPGETTDGLTGIADGHMGLRAKVSVAETSWPLAAQE